MKKCRFPPPAYCFPLLAYCFWPTALWLSMRCENFYFEEGKRKEKKCTFAALKN